MRSGLLPLFPLNVVLFPGEILPLHIFEERYKILIGEALRDQSEFGIVHATGNGVAPVGCTATVERVLQEYDDGRKDIVTIGRRRFRLAGLDDEREFLRGEVEFFGDDNAELGPMALRAQLAAEASQRQGTDIAFSPTDPQLSFGLARAIDDVKVRMALLNMRSEMERIQMLARILPMAYERKRRIEQVRSVAPRNGHSKHIDTDLIQ